MRIEAGRDTAWRGADGAMPPARPGLRLRAERRKVAIGWSCAGAVLVSFAVYVGLHLVAREEMSRIALGTSISWALVMGYAMLLFTVLVTGVYVTLLSLLVAPLLRDTDTPDDG